MQALGPLEVFRADLDDEGSFDEALAGCHFAFLVAAPVNLASQNPEVLSLQRCAHILGYTSPFYMLDVMHYSLLCTVTTHYSLYIYGHAGRTDRACCPRKPERHEVVRESRDGEARVPDLVGGRGGAQRQVAARRRRWQPCRPGRGDLARRRVPQSQQAGDMG